MIRHFTLFIFLFYFCFHFHVVLSNLNYWKKENHHYPKVAICITGQLERWIPESHLENLVKANPAVFFSFFFHLQIANHFHATAFNKKFGFASNFTSLPLSQMVSSLSEMYTTTNSEFADLKFEEPYSYEEWQTLMNRVNLPLDRIREFTKQQTLILNMYKNHESCIKALLYYEERKNITFDYIIITREDLYYFHPFNITRLFPYFTRKNHLSMKCDLLSKNCMEWGGINMRLQLSPRNQGLEIFGKKLQFYQSLFRTNERVENPESYELFFVKHLSYEFCGLPVDIYPVTAARINDTEGNLCILEKEFQTASKVARHSCVPATDFEKMLNFRCKPEAWKVILPPPSEFHIPEI